MFVHVEQSHFTLGEQLVLVESSVRSRLVESWQVLMSDCAGWNAEINRA